MRLDAWLKQNHSTDERMALVERLAQALNAVHDRGEALVSIAPERVEVGNDLRCDLSPSQRGKPEPGYAAPERLEGEEPSTAADVYSVGALCWEILVGRPCGEAPKPLAEAAPDVPRELANAVMGCLERSAAWRPKDLTYVAQLAAAQQKGGRRPEPQPERARSQPRSSALPRTPPRRESRSHLPLLLAAVLLVAAAASSYLWLHRQQTGPSVAARPVPRSAPVPTPQPQATPAEAKAPVTPTAPPSERPLPSASATPTPRAAAAVPLVPEPTPPPASLATPTPVVQATPTPEPRPASVAAVEPSVLTAVSPLTVRRPGKVMLDLRGTGLRSDQRVLILALKEAPKGITIVRQKWTSPSLVSVLIELDAHVAPAAYAIALESANGERTNPLQLTVTK
jgi:hypothetical protein